MKLLSLTKDEAGEERAILELRNGAYVHVTHTNEGLIVDVYPGDTADSVGSLCVEDADLDPLEDADRYE